jgi:hypothetical protein
MTQTWTVSLRKNISKFNHLRCLAGVEGLPPASNFHGLLCQPDLKAPVGAKRQFHKLPTHSAAPSLPPHPDLIPRVMRDLPATLRDPTKKAPSAVATEHGANSRNIRNGDHTFEPSRCARS